MPINAASLFNSRTNASGIALRFNTAMYALYHMCQTSPFAGNLQRGIYKRAPWPGYWGAWGCPEALFLGTCRGLKWTQALVLAWLGPAALIHAAAFTERWRVCWHGFVCT